MAAVKKQKNSFVWHVRLGKTHISTMLRQSGEWYHYSIDYRIGTRYMGEHIEDSYKEDAMKSPYLRELLRRLYTHFIQYKF